MLAQVHGTQSRASRPIGLARGYALPVWATPDTMVLCSSYSGNTEETLGVYEATRQASSVVVEAAAAMARRGGEATPTTRPGAATRVRSSPSDAAGDASHDAASPSVAITAPAAANAIARRAGCTRLPRTIPDTA